jgi:hypothetical protein
MQDAEHEHARDAMPFEDLADVCLHRGSEGIFDRSISRNVASSPALRALRSAARRYVGDMSRPR